MNRTKVITLVVVVLVVSLIAFRLVSNKKHIDANKRIPSGDLAPVAVNVAIAEERVSELNLTLVGTVSPNQEIDIKSEVPGKITNMYFKLGDFVQKGKTLAKVDDRIKVLADENAQQKLADAKQNLERYKNLYEGGAASKAQYDQYQLAYNNARIQLEQSGKELSNTNIVAPISGYITLKNADAGDFTSVGSAIATIVDISSLKVNLSVAERDAYALNVGDNVKITSAVYPGITFNGRITFVSFKGDAAHNYPVEISIENQPKNPLKAGTYVDISFNRKNQGKTLQIPREALIGSIKDAKVYVLSNENKVHLKPVLISGEHENYLEVSKGLTAGEKVVVTGQINLNEGSPVAIIH